MTSEVQMRSSDRSGAQGVLPDVLDRLRHALSDVPQENKR